MKLSHTSFSQYTFHTYSFAAFYICVEVYTLGIIFLLTYCKYLSTYACMYLKSELTKKGRNKERAMYWLMP